MSKTVDELVALFQAARGRGNVNRTEGDRKGIAAVVQALRDEMGFWWTGCDCCDRNEDVFDEILGDAGEKVAGGSTRKDGKAGSSATITVAETGASPAADHSPKVCEWTQQNLQAFYNSACGLNSMTHGNAVCKCQDTCPSCKAPIKFTEAKT